MEFSRLKEVLSYSPETGVFTRVDTGLPAGGNDGLGYIRIRVDGKKWKAHRLAFLYMTGELPADMVDHINGDRSDNRWSNLRQASRAQNIQNQYSPRRDNTVGFLGVNRHKGKFVARIGVNGKRKFLGAFDTAEEAGEVYQLAKQMLHVSQHRGT